MVDSTVCKDLHEAEMFTFIDEESANSRLYYLL